jgi:dTMP kinase
MFVVLEGIDGVGKSTVTRLVAEMLGFVPYATPPKEYMERRREIDLNGSPQQKFNFFRDGVIVAADEIKQLILEGKSVVCDRYWMTTYVYHKVIGVQVAEHDFINLLQPNLTVLLTASPEHQLQRLIERGMSINDTQMVPRNLQLRQEYDELFNKELFINKSVSTDNRTAKQVANHVVRTIKLHAGLSRG